MTAVMLLGFLLGIRHATDADHVIAIATIVSRPRSRWSAALIGSLWGVGHTVTIVVVGGVIILFDLVIPPRLGLAMEFAVAMMLIALGVASLTGFTTRVAVALTEGRSGPGHTHAHAHDDYVHAHAHGHRPGAHGHADAETPLARLDRRLGGLGTYQIVRPLIVGLVHGLAGSAAVALLVLASIRDPLWGMLYLLLFGAGTVVGMMAVTTLIALPIAYSAGRFAAAQRYIVLAAGVLSIGVGLFLAYQIGLVDGLFTGNPQWDPK